MQSTKFRQPKVQDIVLYTARALDGTPVTTYAHRIIDGNRQDGWTIKGDNNDQPDYGLKKNQSQIPNLNLLKNQSLFLKQRASQSPKGELDQLT